MNINWKWINELFADEMIVVAAYNKIDKPDHVLFYLYNSINRHICVFIYK